MTLITFLRRYKRTSRQQQQQKQMQQQQQQQQLPCLVNLGTPAAISFAQVAVGIIIILYIVIVIVIVTCRYVWRQCCWYWDCCFYR